MPLRRYSHLAGMTVDETIVLAHAYLYREKEYRGRAQPMTAAALTRAVRALARAGMVEPFADGLTITEAGADLIEGCAESWIPFGATIH